MARKKTTEEIAPEAIEETIEPVEEVVETKPKRTRKKKVEEPVEEVAVETTAVEPVPEVTEEPDVEVAPVVEEVKSKSEVAPIAEVKPVKEKKVEEPVAEPKKTESGYDAVATSNLYVLKVPGSLATKLGSFKAGTKFTVLEESKGWGKIAEGKWINLNYIEKI